MTRPGREAVAGRCLWKALITVAGLEGAKPREAEKVRRVIGDVLADHKRAC
jgi:hypothetical protein